MKIDVQDIILMIMASHGSQAARNAVSVMWIEGRLTLGEYEQLLTDIRHWIDKPWYGENPYLLGKEMKNRED